MRRKQDILLIVLFCTFIGIMAAGIAFLPKQSISVNEKRTMAKFPEFNVEKVLNGKWEKDFESYISDHFPARNFFAATDSYYMLYTGRNGSNGVYKGHDGYLFDTPVKCDESKLQGNINAVVDFASETGIETTIMVVPTAGYVMSERLPKVHREYKDGEIINTAIKNQLDASNIDMIDIIGEFIERKNDTMLFYKTDHHWTSEGAYVAYRKWAEHKNIEVRAETDYSVENHDGFYGTGYSKSALWNEKSDSIELWEYPIDVTVTLDNGLQHDSMFFKEHIDELDKYPVFLDGNHGFERIINNDNPSSKKILVIKDSYAHCFVPFMAEHYSQIDMVDLRYYLDSVSELADENVYDEVLVLYGIRNLCEATDLSILQ